MFTVELILSILRNQFEVNWISFELYFIDV